MSLSDGFAHLHLRRNDDVARRPSVFQHVHQNADALAGDFVDGLLDGRYPRHEEFAHLDAVKADNASGTRRPMSVRARMTPIATVSDMQKTAVVSLCVAKKARVVS